MYLLMYLLTHLVTYLLSFFLSHSFKELRAALPGQELHLDGSEDAQGPASCRRSRWLGLAKRLHLSKASPKSLKIS